MKLSHIFFALSLLLMVLCALVLFQASSEQNTWFYVAEGMVVLSLTILVVFYTRLVRPIRAFATGLGLLQGQDLQSRLRKIGQPEVDAIVDAFNPLLERLKEEHTRMLSQERVFSLVMERSPLGIIALDTNDRIIIANPSATLYAGAELTPGMTIEEIGSPMTQALAAMQKPSEEISFGDERRYRISRLKYMDLGVEHTFFLIEDVSSVTAKAESETYEKIVRLISHEVNNTTAGLTATMRVVADGLQADEAEAVEACSERMVELSRFIGQYADLARLPRPVLKPVSLTSWLMRRKTELQALCSQKDVQFRFELPKEDLTVHIDPVLLDRALINIVKNAAESAGCTEVIISINLRKREMIITDNGAGIAPGIAGKLFTPLFTTKPSGQGLGLMLVSSVLRGHSCRYSLRTGIDDHLTRFTIRFPYSPQTDND